MKIVFVSGSRVDGPRDRFRSWEGLILGARPRAHRVLGPTAGRNSAADGRSGRAASSDKPIFPSDKAEMRRLRSSSSRAPHEILLPCAWLVAVLLGACGQDTSSTAPSTVQARSFALLETLVAGDALLSAGVSWRDGSKKLSRMSLAARVPGDARETFALLTNAKERHARPPARPRVRVSERMRPGEPHLRGCTVRAGACELQRMFVPRSGSLRCGALRAGRFRAVATRVFLATPALGCRQARDVDPSAHRL